MANQSAKKNEQAIRGKIQILYYVIYPIFALFVVLNMFFLINESISFWHLLWCLVVAALSHICIKQIIKCWELQLPPEASDYYIDVLAMNLVVAVVDPFTHKVWNIYWLVVVFIVVKLGKYLWEYITPKYEQKDEQGTKKEKKEKKERVKYIKK